MKVENCEASLEIKETPANGNEERDTAILVDIKPESPGKVAMHQEEIPPDSDDGKKREEAASGEDREPPVLSKRARKRLEKKKAYEMYKKERRYCIVPSNSLFFLVALNILLLFRAKEREKRKKRRLEISTSSLVPSRKKLKETTMANSTCHTGIVVDLSFDAYMDEKSLAKCIKQVARCYSINRRASNPAQFHVCSLAGKSLEEMKKHQGYVNWDVRTVWFQVFFLRYFVNGYFTGKLS